MLTGEPPFALAAGMAIALRDIHAAGVVHGQVRPDLVAAGGARIALCGFEPNGRYRDANAHLAPEQALGADVATAKSDVFSQASTVFCTAACRPLVHWQAAELRHHTLETDVGPARGAVDRTAAGPTCRVGCGICLRKMQGAPTQQGGYYRRLARTLAPGSVALADHPSYGQPSGESCPRAVERRRIRTRP